MHELMYGVSRGTATRETEIQIKMLILMLVSELWKRLEGREDKNSAYYASADIHLEDSSAHGARAPS